MKTIKDIAELASVSRTTVSRVLNNSGYVSEKARKSVLKVIEETGYIPSAHAKSLRTKQTKVIGVILPKISTETSSRVVNGVNEVLAKKGYQILLANTNRDQEKEIEYLKLLQSRQVDGVMLLATNTNEELHRELVDMKIPVIVVGQEMSGIPSITFDDYGAAHALAAKMIEHGYRKIAYIGVDEEDKAVGMMRKHGFMDAMAAHGLVVQPEWVQTGDFSIESGYQAAERIFDHGCKPDAIFAATSRMALGVWRYAQEKGLDMPKELGLAGIGTTEAAVFISPNLTTIEYEYECAGNAAGELMMSMLEGKQKKSSQVILDYRLIERDSL